MFSGVAESAAQQQQQQQQQPSPKVRPRLHLRSHKMAGLKDLLLAEKLNTHAISLQLTAQSQVQRGSRGKLRDSSAAAGVVDAAKDVKSGGEAPADAGPPALQPAVNVGSSRPKRTRKE